MSRELVDKQKKSIVTLTVILALSLTIVSIYGGFVPGTYARDAESMAAQGMGQDIVDLFLVVPLLILSLVFMLKNSKVAFYVFSGTVFYILYSFFIYSFGVYFNKLFLLYCLTLGASLYLFILVICEANKNEPQNWFGERTPVKWVGLFLIVVAALFYMLWLKDVLPAIISDTVPKNVSDYNLLVNPVHVLDIAIALPGLIVTGIMLLKKHKAGFIFAPVFLVFTVILAIALAGMVVMLKVKNVSDDISIAIIFVILAAISTVLLFLFLKHIKKETAAPNNPDLPG